MLIIFEQDYFLREKMFKKSNRRLRGGRHLVGYSRFGRENYSQTTNQSYPFKKAFENLTNRVMGRSTHALWRRSIELYVKYGSIGSAVAAITRLCCRTFCIREQKMSKCLRTESVVSF